MDAPVMATDPRVETIRLLTSIDASLRGISLALVRILDAQVDREEGIVRVNDNVCNGPHGDPTVKAKSPRDWTGPDMKGRKFSECPPTYLDLMADRFDYFASKEGADEKDVRYAKLDAQRARAWAARLRAGWTAPAPAGFAEGDF